LPTGYKTFLDDTVLPADDINGYLMQGILVFTDASDRDTSLVGNLREGIYAYLKSDKSTSVYNGTAWVTVGRQDVEFASEAARNSAIPSPFEGQYAYTTDNLKAWKYTSGVWRERPINNAYATEAARNTAFPSPVNGQYAYITGTLTTFQRSGGAWVKVGPDLLNAPNFVSFTASGSTTAPLWATQMFYVIVAGGATGGTTEVVTQQAQGGAGGQVLQGNLAITPGGTVTVTVGGAGANSSIAGVATATGGGGAAGGVGAGNGGAGTLPSGLFSVGYYGGGGGGCYFHLSTEAVGASGGIGGGGNGYSFYFTSGGPRAGAANSGGGGGASRPSPGGATGGSGIVLLYFS
jgi:hypothetical protein